MLLLTQNCLKIHTIFNPWIGIDTVVPCPTLQSNFITSIANIPLHIIITALSLAKINFKVVVMILHP